MEIPTYKTEFPSFKLGDGIEIPEHWNDTSWHNDACPSWQNGDRKLFIEFEKFEDRDSGSELRFYVVEYCGRDPRDDEWEDLCHTDDWAEVLRVMNYEK